MHCTPISSLFFFFNDTATTEIYTLSLHDALPISRCRSSKLILVLWSWVCWFGNRDGYIKSEGVNHILDRKSTRLNSSHTVISYAVFCLKKKKKKYRLIA